MKSGTSYMPRIIIIKKCESDKRAFIHFLRKQRNSVVIFDVNLAGNRILISATVPAKMTRFPWFLSSLAKFWSIQCIQVRIPEIYVSKHLPILNLWSPPALNPSWIHRQSCISGVVLK